MTKWTAAALSLLGIVLAAWWFRWDVHVIDRHDSATAYIVDRITGRVYFARGEDAIQVTREPAK